MQLKKILSISLVLLFLLPSCSKELSIEKLVYVGNWESDDSTLYISKDGTALYKHSDNGRSSDASGAVKINSRKIIIGNGLIKKRFQIVIEPYEEKGEILMNLDGDIYHRH